METMPKVGIVMGSDSDMKVMSKAADMLEKLGIPVMNEELYQLVDDFFEKMPQED